MQRYFGHEKGNLTTDMEKKLLKNQLPNSVLTDLKALSTGIPARNVNNQNRLKMFGTQKDQ